MAECVEYLVGFVYSLLYKTDAGGNLIIEGELLSFNDTQIEIKGNKGAVVIEKVQILKIDRKGK